MRRVLVTVFCLVCTAEPHAQRIIYDAKRDTTAQQAAAAAKDVTSGTLFDSMLRNVDAQAKLEVDTVSAFIQERMRAKLNAFEVWSDPNARPAIAGPGFSVEAAKLCPRSVECVLRTLRQQHQAALSAPALTTDELNTRLEAIKAKRVELQAQLKQLEASKPGDPIILRAFELLEDHGADAVEYAEKITEFASTQTGFVLNGVGNALTAIGSGMDQVIALYKAIGGIWRGQQAVKVDPASLRPPPEQTDLQLLAIDQAHLKTRARIEARKQVEVGAALAGVEAATGALQAAGVTASTETIEASLRTAAIGHDRRTLLNLVAALHEVASAVAQLDAAQSLADLRLSDEERRYSIRRSAVNASTYDQTIQAAVQRLALYWKSGLKPSELAQFAFYITNTFAIPAIAFR